MDLPSRCEGCPELKRILDSPIKSFGDRVTEETGKKVYSISYSGDVDLKPDTVHLRPEGMVPVNTIDRIWRDMNTDKRDVASEVQQMTERCSGLLDTGGEAEAIGQFAIKICGEKVLESLGK